MKNTLFALTFLCMTLPATAAHFPLCMYGVGPADVPTLKQAGFTCLQSYGKEPKSLAVLAKVAQENDMQVVFYPNEVIGSDYQEAAQNWPVLAWYLVDEPDVWKWSRERVTQAHQKARAAFPNHKTALVIGQGKTRIPYYDLSDNLLMDWYPVPHLALTSFGDNVRWAKEGQVAMGAGDRPLWGVVQIFDWKEYKQHRPDNDRIGRFPTENEIRFMSYDGILNGATGLFYFIFVTQDKPLPTAQPEWWSRVTAVSKELAKFRPILEEGTLADNPVEVAAPLAAQTRLYKKHLYTILLNRSDAPVNTPKTFLKRKYKLLFGNKKSNQIGPYTVWILKSKK